MPLRQYRINDNEEDIPESSTAALKRRRMLIEDSENDEEEYSQPKKRAPITKLYNYNSNNSDSEVEEDEGDEDEENSQEVNRSLIYEPLESLNVGEDGYVEGSIIKITLKNFVTYDYCEIKPGPQLNMIIGPNGTGKSTIVCAIALGLGGSTSLLGRAKNVSEFVKTGEEEAYIQIELKRVGKKNTVIYRHINRTNNTSNWKLDGRATSQREVMNIISKLNIQVDNLCQFLPQDKVAEFAQLTPCQLLVRTQVAVGDKSLSSQHEKLIEKRNQLKILDKTHASNLNRHKDLESRNQLLQKDVQKIKEREVIAKRISLLKAKLPLAKYTDAKKRYDEAKVEEQELKNQKLELEQAIAPLQSTVNELKNADHRILSLKKSLEEDTRDLAKQLTKIQATIQDSKSNVKSYQAQIEGLKRREKGREQEIQKLENQIAVLEDSLREEPPSDSLELVEAINNITQEVSQLNVEISNDESMYRDLNRQKKSTEALLNQSKRSLNELKDIGRIKMENLKQVSMDTYKAYMWYRDNKTLFKGKIFGPIQLCINIKDKRFANQIETALGGREGSHLKTFVCEYAEDYKKFMAEMVDKQKLRLTASWPGNIDVDALINTPCSDEELKARFGLDHFVLNLLDGPPLVLAYLCQQININNYVS
ncbi:P-loop containing nucleoside triphosphate hydrolase protein [Cunninghamella echinulata]|nr:P-loop containing nucleoside triphosphate hydrolase protein [Cunninghamella echinulata]